MSEIEEIGLTKVTSLLSTDYIRGIRVSDGESIDILLSDLRLQLANITGLTSALDGKMPQASAVGELAILDALGNAINSGIQRVVFTDITDLDTYFEGVYACQNISDVPDSVMGNVKWLFAFDNSEFNGSDDDDVPYTRTWSWQLIVASNGVFLREYTGSTWSNARYVGGSQNCIQLPYATIADLIADSKLSPSAPYMITDVGQDEGIILRAASSNALEQEGIRLALVPKHFDVGTFDGIVWKGAWDADGTYAEDDHAIRYGRVWRNLTGVVGTEDGFGLDSTNWLFITPTVGDFYARETHGCRYRFVSNLPLVYTKGYVSKQWDARGNVFGVDVEPVDGFLVEYNDFGNEFIYGNELKSCRNNNSVDADSSIYNNNGKGDIHDVRGFKVYENVLTDENNNIRDLNGTDGVVFKNVLLNDADIQYLHGASNVSYNTIESDLKGDSAAYCTAVVTYSHIGPSVVKDNILLKITNCRIYGHIDGNTDVWIINSVMEEGSTLVSKNMAGYNISSSILCLEDETTETFTAPKTIRQTRNKIVAECYVGAGTFVVANGSSYVAPSSVSGCSKTNVRANGITLNGTSIADASFTAQYVGWHRIRCIASAHASNKCNFKTICYVNSTPQQNVYNEKNYTTSGDFVNSIVEGNILLAVGDVVSFRFQHDYASPVTITLGQITADLEYNN